MNLLWAYNQCRACTSAVSQTALCWYDWQQKEKLAAWWMGWPERCPRVLHRKLLCPLIRRASQAKHLFCTEIYLTWSNRFVSTVLYHTNAILHKAGILGHNIYLFTSSLYYSIALLTWRWPASDWTKEKPSNKNASLSTLSLCYSVKQSFSAYFRNFYSDHLQTVSSEEIMAALIAKYLTYVMLHWKYFKLTVDLESQFYQPRNWKISHIFILTNQQAQICLE